MDEGREGLGREGRVMRRASTRLRELIARGPTLFIPGCFNAVSARVLEGAGFEAVYMTGYGTSLALTGLPDVGLTTMSEMVANARYIASSVRVPLIADADTGFGNAINVIRTLREYIGAGVAGLHMEDQVNPKRCGHVAGRVVIPIEEAVGKIRAAVDTRNDLDPDFVIVARTDARGASGGSLDEAIRRANAYLEAGADLAFVEGPTSVDEVKRVCREVKGRVFYNMTGVSPRFTMAEMRELGIAVCIAPNAMLRSALGAMHDLAVAMKAEGPVAETRFMEAFKSHPLGDLHTFAGFDQVRAWEREYLGEEAMKKYADSVGHIPK
jgi:2-methylisocitrate lyase-like PEP mutase family enzyme